MPMTWFRAPFLARAATITTTRSGFHSSSYPMLSPCLRLVSALPAPADHSTSTSDFHDSRCPTGSQLLRRRMQAVAAKGDLSEALDALGRLRPMPAAPDYNALLHAYLRSERAAPGHVAAVISHMRHLGPAPNALTFNTAFNGLLRLGHLDAAHAVLDEMWSCCGFVPSFTAVGRLVRKAVSAANFDLALKVFDLMLRLGYLPALPITKAIVSVLLKSNGSEVAYEVFLLLVNRGFVPDVYIYKTNSFRSVQVWSQQ